MPPAHAASPPAGVSATFWRLCLEEPLADAYVLDVGTGSGRIALALAPRVRGVAGIDREATAIADAGRRAAALGIRNTTFQVADADRADYGSLTPEPPALITAHLFLSGPLVERGAKALAPGGALVALGFHVDHRREAGRPSRFAFDEPRMSGLIEGHGLRLEHLSVERDVETFDSPAAALAAVRGHEPGWKTDGRWSQYQAFLVQGGRTLTRSYLVVKARKPGPRA